ncbi:hypothetical protein P9112_011915 [Eukaryota sp. TZLM1-RC]
MFQDNTLYSHQTVPSAVGHSSPEVVQVFVRIRPSPDQPVVFPNNNTVILKEPTRDNIFRNKRRKTHRFTFHKVFSCSCSQSDVFFQAVEPLLSDFFSGFNCNLLAMGSTFSGKTFSIIGEIYKEELFGVIPRVLSKLFENDSSCTFKISFIELYQEKVYDLLSSTTTNELSIFDDDNGNSIVSGLSNIIIESFSQAMTLLKRALTNRATFATDANPLSSRSHALVTISRFNSSTNTINYFRIADLAGNERKSTNTGERLKEGSFINKSLLALGTIISTLSDQKSSGFQKKRSNKVHIPFRQSKLTRLLKSAFVGNSKTVLLSTINPSIKSYEDTLNTLSYSTRAMGISKPCRISNEIVEKEVTPYYEGVIEQLKDQLKHELQKRTDYCYSTKQDISLRDEIIKQCLRIFELINLEKLELGTSRSGLFLLLRNLENIGQELEDSNNQKSHLFCRFCKQSCSHNEDLVRVSDEIFKVEPNGRCSEHSGFQALKGLSPQPPRPRRPSVAVKQFNLPSEGKCEGNSFVYPKNSISKCTSKDDQKITKSNDTRSHSTKQKGLSKNSIAIHLISTDLLDVQNDRQMGANVFKSKRNRTIKKAFR